jgi:hypothetical protein
LTESEHRSQHRLLGRVSRQVAITDHPATTGYERVIVAAHEFSERGPITPTRRPHHAPIIAKDRHLQSSARPGAERHPEAFLLLDRSRRQPSTPVPADGHTEGAADESAVTGHQGG